MALINTGYLEYEELSQIQKLPSDERYAKGPVAVIECVQEIPCNPCCLQIRSNSYRGSDHESSDLFS